VSTQECCVISGFSDDAAKATRAAGGDPRLLSKPARRWCEIGRWFEMARCALPLGILALLPKCPLCLVAYIAAVSGIGISMAAAAYFRTGLLLVCFASLGYFAICAASRFRDQRRRGHCV
jgi:hypothetical protein